MSDTLGHRRKQCFWGWGYPNEALNADEIAHLREMARLFGADGARVKRLNELREAVNVGLKSAGPFIIDVMMSGQELGKPGFVDTKPG